MKLPTSADHAIGNLISQNQIGGLSNVLVTLDKSGNIIHCQPLSCEDGHLTSTEIVMVQKNGASRPSLGVTHSNEEKSPPSVSVNLNNLQENNKEGTSTEFFQEMIDITESNEVTVMTTHENEENDVPPSSTDVTSMEVKTNITLTKCSENVGLNTTSKEDNIDKGSCT